MGNFAQSPHAGAGQLISSVGGPLVGSEERSLLVEAENLFHRLSEQLGRLRKIGDALLGQEPTPIATGKLEQGQPANQLPLASYLRMHHELLTDLQVQITRIEARI